MLFLDYDGTLSGFHNDPQKAAPDEALYDLLDALTALPNTDVYLISGRDKETFTKWFLTKKYNMIVEHGVWISENGSDFTMLENVKNDWMEKICPSWNLLSTAHPAVLLRKKTIPSLGITAKRIPIWAKRAS